MRKHQEANSRRFVGLSRTGGRERAELDAFARAISKHPNAQMSTGRNRASVSVAILEREVKLSDQHVVLC
jgi:hypothetical protein